jgi:hypothetical protein
MGCGRSKPARINARSENPHPHPLQSHPPHSHLPHRNSASLPRPSSRRSDKRGRAEKRREIDLNELREGLERMADPDRGPNWTLPRAGPSVGKEEHSWDPMEMLTYTRLGPSD